MPFNIMFQEFISIQLYSQQHLQLNSHQKTPNLSISLDRDRICEMSSFQNSVVL